jgi:hypothetical protein
MRSLDAIIGRDVSYFIPALASARPDEDHRRTLRLGLPDDGVRAMEIRR